MIKGIDISNNNEGLDISNLDIDFCIIKASEGVDFTDYTMPKFISQCKNKSIPFGLFHYAYSDNPIDECTHFLNVTSDYVDEFIPCLDIENFNIVDWTNFINKFCCMFHDERNIWPWVYTSAGFLYNINECKAVENCPLWVAGYPVTYTTWANEYCPYLITPFNNLACWQFTETLFLESDFPLDGDICYMSQNEMYEYGKGRIKKTKKKNNVAIAYDVILGKWGKGLERKTRLTKAGYDYNAVQSEVNNIYNLAYKTIRGNFGNGSKRKQKLGSYYEPVQYVINNIL